MIILNYRAYAKGMPMEQIMHRLVPTFFIGAFLSLSIGCSAPPEPKPEPAPEPVAVEPAPAPRVQLKPDYPERYIVVKGDTLWDISAMFLKDPWRWPEVWQKNPHVTNPHLIYPGDILTLVYGADGQPMITLTRPGQVITETVEAGVPVVKLSPEMRIEELAQAIPTIPSDAISAFLNRPRVLSEEELETAPYIVSSPDEHLVIGAGNSIYVRNMQRTDLSTYLVVRPGRTYVDPESDEVLGYEAIYLGEARVQRYGDPATLHLITSTREILPGDKLMPVGEDIVEQSYFPRVPEEDVQGHIIHVVDGVVRIGQFHVVVLDRGRQDGLSRGHVLSVMQRGQTLRDYRGKGWWSEEVTMPDERAGVLMVFRVFERVSYALVMDATRTMRLLDRVKRP